LDNSTTSPRIGLALGSGASRGWSHIGVLNALLAAGIEPDIVCGTSVGAIVGGSYVSGNLDKLEEWILGSTRSDVLRFLGINFWQTGFVDEQKLGWFLHHYVADESICIENLTRKYAAVSTDLNTGREVWFMEGILADAVRASMAMPGLFSPVRNDQQWLVDGGLVNPVPVSTCRALGADIVIAVSLNSGVISKRDNTKKDEPTETAGLLSSFKQQAKEYSNSIFPNRDEKEETPGTFYAVAKSINIVQDRITRSRLAGDPAEILLAPRLAHIGMLEFHRAAEAISEGEDCVAKALEDICRAVGKK